MRYVGPKYIQCLGLIHSKTPSDDGNDLLSVIPSINGVIGNDTGPGPDTIMISIDLPIPANEWSAQWSSGGPNKLHVEGQYARSHYGTGPSGDPETILNLSPPAPGKLLHHSVLY